MNEEKKIILKMLEEGKINSDEAIKLLEALDQDRPAKAEGLVDSKKVTETLESVGSTITDTVVSLVDGFKNIDFSSLVGGNYESFEKNITEDISQLEDPILDISSLNGFIKVDQVEGPKMMIKVDCRYKADRDLDPEELFTFSINDNLISFEPSTKARNCIINLYILLPKRTYKDLSLKTTNASIELDKLRTGSLHLKTSNARVVVRKAEADEATISSTNGKIEVEDLTGKKLDLLTSNGSISLLRLDESFIYAKTSNSSIRARDLETNNFMATTSNGRILLDNLEATILELTTSNSSIEASFNNKNLASSYDLTTSFGSINLNRPDLVYEIRDLDRTGPKRILAKDKDFNSSSDQRNLKIKTSHGSISLD